MTASTYLQPLQQYFIDIRDLVNYNNTHRIVIRNTLQTEDSRLRFSYSTPYLILLTFVRITNLTATSLIYIATASSAHQ